jgi:hypothetical protein
MRSHLRRYVMTGSMPEPCNTHTGKYGGGNNKQYQPDMPTAWRTAPCYVSCLLINAVALEPPELYCCWCQWALLYNPLLLLVIAPAVSATCPAASTT